MARTRRYRMTPRRREALRKAQAASARKRRRGARKRILAGVGIAGALAGASVAGVAISTRMRQSSKPKRVSTGPGKELDLIRVGPIKSGSNWGIVGRPVVRTVVGKTVRKKKYPNYIESERRRLKHIESLDKKAFQARRRYHNRRRSGLSGRPPKNG